MMTFLPPGFLPALLGIFPPAAGLLLSSAALAASPASPPRPNFVIVIADDMGWDDCGPYGNPAVRTPNLDRLAREGMRFDRAWLTCSSCSPSRSSILTGRYPHSTGIGELHLPWNDSHVLMTTPLRQAGYWTALAGKWHPTGDAGMQQFDLVKQGGGASGCEHWTETLRARPKDKPFFLWLASYDAHRPYKPGDFATPHDPAQVIVPPYFPDTPEVRGDLALYYDEISRLDGFVGRVLDELKDQGILDTTFVLFLSDNGRPFPRDKTSVYDSGVKTPFLVRYPRLAKPGSTSASLVSSVDIAPTVLDLAGLAPLPGFQGKSFAPLLRDPAAMVRPYAFAEHNWHDFAGLERGVRSPRFNYIRNWRPDLPGTPAADAFKSETWQAMLRLHQAGKLPPQQTTCFTTPRPAEELYDTEKDPHALHNLAGNPEYAPILGEMRAALAAWQKETSDTFDPQAISPDGFDRQTGAKIIKASHPRLQKKAP